MSEKVINLPAVLSEMPLKNVQSRVEMIKGFIYASERLCHLGIGLSDSLSRSELYPEM